MKIPPPLLTDIAEGRCLPFIGAGFSLNADLPNDQRMPSWAELGSQLAAVAGCSSDMDSPDIAAVYERKYGRVHLIEAIRALLHPDKAQPGSAHTAFAQLPFDTIYTTNFDLLLEKALTKAGKPFLPLVGELQLPFHGGSLTSNVVKMHGDIHHGEHIIVTRNDYDQFLVKYPAIATHLSAMLITRTALFIGYSRTDEDFQQIEKVVKSRLGKYRRMPYIVQFNTEPTEVDRLLDQGQHIISLEVRDGENKDEILAAFFTAIQRQIDISQTVEFREARPDAFEPLSKEALERTYDAPDASLLFASSSSLCFVIMPPGPEFDQVYHLLVKPAVDQSGLEAIRADEIISSGVVDEQVRVAIQQSRLCIVDLTNDNPNVLYELGVAQALGKPVILISQRKPNIDVDRTGARIGMPVLHYDLSALEDAQNALGSMLRGMQGESRLESAERYIMQGMYRAGVANLGVILEHSLQLLLESTPDVRRSQKIGSRKPIGSGLMLGELSRVERITEEDRQALSKFLAIRNKAVHELDEPTRDEANFALSVVRDFEKRYFPSDGPESNLYEHNID